MIKNWKKLLIGVLAIIVILIVVIVKISQSPEVTPPEEIDSGEEEIVLSEKANVQTIRENSKTNIKMINIEYPNLQSFRNQDFQKYVNDSIIKVINAYKNEINAVIDEQTPETASYYYKTKYYRYNNGDYLSLVVENDYQTTGIRSNKWMDIYNINVRTERLITLEDLFPANMDYKKEILQEITKQAEQKNYTLMNGEGIQRINDNQKFYIQDAKLIIYFDPSEIAPATYGALQFEMPFVLNEEGKFVL